LYRGWSVKILFDFYKKNRQDEKIKNQVKIIAQGFVYTALWIILILGLTALSVSFGYSGGDKPGFFVSIGVIFFATFTVYAIAKYQLLNIKVILVQVVVVGLSILIGSQFLFVQNNINITLTGVSFVLSIVFGYILIKSVKLEIERKEQLQMMTDSLAQANDQLRKLDNAKTEFISIASHQLRTPVTAIKGFTSLILEGSYGEISKSVHESLEKIYISSDRLVNLIEDLLNVSRIESGRMTFSFEKSSVGKVLKELHENFLLIAKTKKFYLDLKLPNEPLPEIIMDASKVRELISNFIDNAFKYTERGGVTVSAEIREAGVIIDDKGFVKNDQISPYGKVVRITVSDTGVGIPKEEIPYLFRKFSRGKDVSRLHVGGTGLGLYVGKSIAEAHHGQTWVESDGAGKGSKFIIEIPIAGATN
jgi:signal transduction histidine kinase